MAESALKLNLPKRSLKYQSVPAHVFGMKIARRERKDKEWKIVMRDGEHVMRDLHLSELKLIGEIYSFSNMKGKPDELCKRSLTDFQNATGYSRSTVSANVNTITAEGIVTQKKNFHDKAEYKFEGKKDNELFINFEECLKHIEFEFPREDRKREMRDYEYFLISFMGSYCNIPGAKGCQFTLQELCDKTGICLKYLRKGLRSLIDADLLYCNNRLWYARTDKRFKFNVRKEIRLLMIHTPRRASEKQGKEYSEEPARQAPVADWKQAAAEAALAADLRGEREHFYAVRHQRALDLAAENRKKAAGNADFKKAEIEIPVKELELSRAEVHHSDKVPELRRVLEDFKERHKNALRLVGLTENDLLPNYECKKCSDTGFMKDGRMCDCYTLTRGSP